MGSKSNQTTKPSRFVLADDHRIVASGLAAELELRGHVVAGVAETGLDAIALIKSEAPDCAVLDINMPGANGAEVFLEAKLWSPKTVFAILTGHPSASLFNSLIEAGVRGVFLKSDDPDQICDGLTALLRGQTVLSPSAIKVMSPMEDSTDLTKREMQVLNCIARGLSNTGIADELGISAKTVETHRSNLMRKLSVHSSATLLMKSVKLGLISVD
ncbi:LuxR C-terminal-related transcriptional regulator [Marivita sp. S0852]|uniref:LuxR C-terminal-related transcriptional regulator n=1 Tax=Marivita sp. S0852 TaxID=3373893 RepID=UPI0039827C88